MKEPILGINFKQHKTPVTHIVWKKVRHFSYIFIDGKSHRFETT